MSTQTASHDPSDMPADLYRSEAFAEDLEDALPGDAQSSGSRSRVTRTAWLLGLPLALVVLGSASALAWA
jgi:hypothetical protein